LLFQKQQLEQQIINEVKNYEQSQFQELGEDNPILKSKKILESKKNQADDILYKSLAKSSSATAKYFCRGRNMILQKIPSYLCNATGLVRLNIKVNSKGFVTDCRIDNIKTTTNDACLIKNALNYASNWRFNQDFEKSQKQDGWIEFTYISQ
jgi:hypothetical protein